MPSWLSFATHLAERRGLFSKNPLSQVQDFLLKVEMALTKPITDNKKDLAMLRREVGIAHVIRGADARKVFPALEIATRVSGDAALDTTGPIEVVSTMTAAEALADIEMILKAEREGSLTPDELFITTESTNGDTTT